MPFADDDLAMTLHGFARAAGPTLDRIAGAGELVTPSGGGAGVVARARNRLSHSTYPGSPVWATMSGQERGNWWVGRVGTIVSLIGAAPELLGPVANQVPVAAALQAGGRGLVLCAVAREHGLVDPAQQVPLLGRLLLDRHLSVPGRIGAPIQIDDAVSRGRPTVAELARTAARLGSGLVQLRRDLDAELERAAPSARGGVLNRITPFAVGRSIVDMRATLRDDARKAADMLAPRGRYLAAPPAVGEVCVPGRRLSSALRPAECGDVFRDLVTRLAGYEVVAPPRWAGRPDDPPLLLVASGARGRAELYLAVWDRGDVREIHMVPAHHPGQLPPALIGNWKMRDGSLSSTGTVDQFPIAYN